MFSRGWVLLLVGGVCVGAAPGTFPTPYDSEKGGQPPMSAAQAAASFQLPTGFVATVVASEPDVRQPVAMAFDLRGRLWVAENYTYAETGVFFATNLMDRVVILEDRDGDGRAETRKVFWDQAQILTSVEPTVDGVYVLCPPRLLFIADRNRDDVPDGEPEVVLDGFTTTTGNRHTFANGLKFGPDGWLWGRIGISSGARIGLPGQADPDRVEMRGGIWRYHPPRRVFEAVCHGTTNPWGLDWNVEGEPFFINTVIGHLWHAIPGAHYQRMHGDDVMPRAYSLLPQAADHFHFDTGEGWTKSRPTGDGRAAPASDGLGGGHAHAALLIYQGTNWPASYRDGLFTWNLHGRRANRERLDRVGSGYVGRHEPDLLAVSDPWFRGIEMLQGPDGGVSIADWSDTGECHEHDGVHRGSGRIYKITHGSPQPIVIPNFIGMATEELIPLILDSNEWTSRAALRVLGSRAGVEERWEAATRLRSLFQKQTSRRSALRAMWALNAMGTATPDWLLARTGDDDEHIRSWGVRLLADRIRVNPTAGPARSDLPSDFESRVFQRWARMARNDSSALVRLYLASALQRLPATVRADVAMGLVGHAEDATDRSMGLMIWYGIEPLAAADPSRFRELAQASRIPQIRRFVARRLAEEISSRPTELDALLTWSRSAAVEIQADLLAGVSEALRGVRRAPMPPGWRSLADTVNQGQDDRLKKLVRELDVVFGDGRATDELKVLAQNAAADPLTRRSAVRSLVEARTPDLGALLRKLADDGALRVTALVSLLEIGEPNAAEAALARYQWLGLEERPTVLSALSARPSDATALLEAVENGRVRRSDLTPFHAGQMARLRDAGVSNRLAQVWGTLRTTGTEKRAEIDRWKSRMTTVELGKARLGRGRAVFQQLCAGCHKLYGDGGEVGPDLTGSGRGNLEYLLENVVDPGAVVAAEQRMSVVQMKDGRVLSGLLRDANERTVTVVGPAGSTVAARAEIQLIETLEQSVMPEGLLESVPADDARDLLAYLMHSRQVPEH
jgi:putative membrane-bound dehydrogenase-like protein